MITSLSCIVTFCVVFEAACLIQAYFHKSIGHGGWLAWIGKTHRGSHHRVYSASTFEAPLYNRHEDGVEFTYIPPGIILTLLTYALLPPVLAGTSLAAVLASFWSHNYIHKQYHLTGSWMLRFAWFRRKKEIHWIHHRDYTKNFGVIDHLWDRLTGSFAGPEAHARYKRRGA